MMIGITTTWGKTLVTMRHIKIEFVPEKEIEN